ncbi:MAG TPA: 6,7-dimethyl-8-ribityllumazine synthase [Longimicrobiales bacterium]|nr:6,7-dimethyl-8-ribityllumazine synthase [Longimicrobiales bacterium]
MTSHGSHAHESLGSVSAAGLRIAVLAARFNGDITERLVEGALHCLRDHGGDPSAVEVMRVPGAWELPQAAARVLRKDGFHAVVALGCVIRGETAHFDYVCDEANRGLGEVARTSAIPVVFGVLTTENHAQALARAGEGPSNKGYEVTLAALQMVDLYRTLEER